MIALELAIFAHVLSDFLFQFNWIVKFREDSKISKSLLGNIIHAAILFVITVGVLVPFVKFDWILIKYCTVIASTHSILDLIKSRISIKNNFLDMILFPFDQVAHIAIIITMWYTSNFTYQYDWIKLFIHNSKTQLFLAYIHIDCNQRLLSNITTFLVIYIYTIIGGDIFLTKALNLIRNGRDEVNFKLWALNVLSSSIVKLKGLKLRTEYFININWARLTSPFRKKDKSASANPETPIQEASIDMAEIQHSFDQTSAAVENSLNEDKNKDNKKKKVHIGFIQRKNEEEKENINHKGKYIGFIERTIILFLVINNQLTAITFLITAKSIARYPQLDNAEFAEEYILGTLGSIVIAILAGIVLLKLKI